MAINYPQINKQVMTDTISRLSSIPELSDAVKKSIKSQFMVSEDEVIDVPTAKECNTHFICSGKRSFEAAKGYPGKRVAVLNYANNHSIGGAPFSAGAQEESLCRCSTLYPCLQAMDVPFYKKHQNDYMAGRLSNMGNDDLIYTPDVIVFKTDERTDPVIPEMLPHEEWYKVNIITCAAPENRHRASLPANYEQIITSRIKKILDIAARERNEVLILGAWGCGAFGNPIDVVARVFCTLLKNYNFETVEFALSSGDGNDSAFARELGKSNDESPFKTVEKPCTPSRISKLEPNEIFVFGSNKEGRHGGGAAADAMDFFGAQWGVGVGRTGQCYAIPTMDGSLELIAEYVEGFRCYAACHPELTFYVTPIGCGIAGWKQEQIAPLFAFAHDMENVILPENW